MGGKDRAEGNGGKDPEPTIASQSCNIYIESESLQGLKNKKGNNAQGSNEYKDQTGCACCYRRPKGGDLPGKAGVGGNIAGEGKEGEVC